MATTKRARKPSKTRRATTKLPARAVKKIKAAAKSAVKKVATKRRVRATATGDTIELFKVVKQGTDKTPKSKKLVSIFTRGKLRLSFSDKKFTKAPHAKLPITGFESRAAAERFCRRNAHRIEHPWVLVAGVGVPAARENIPAGRARRPCDFRGKTGAALATEAQRRQEKRWTRGTVFVQNFKIVEEIRRFEPEAVN